MTNLLTKLLVLKIPQMNCIHLDITKTENNTMNHETEKREDLSELFQEVAEFLVKILLFLLKTLIVDIQQGLGKRYYNATTVHPN